MLEFSQGEIRVEGKSIEDWDPIVLRRHIGYAIQDIGLFPHYTVEKNISLVPQLEGWSEDRIRARVEELMKLLGLDAAKFSKRYPARTIRRTAPTCRHGPRSRRRSAHFADGRAFRRA